MYLKTKLKSLPIAVKVTLWYTVFISIIVFSFLALSIFATKGIIENTSQKELIHKVDEMYNDYPEEFESFDDGIYFSVYGHNGIEQGVVPKKLPGNLPLSLNKITEVNRHKMKFLYYDRAIDHHTYLRGILPISRAARNTKIMTVLLLIIGPLFVVFIALGGYRLIKKAFEPVKNLTETAEQIKNTGDFSKRLYTGETKDEIYNMATVLNSMLDSLESSYNKEKQFSNDVSHELRTPLSVILSQSEYEIMYCEDEEARESFEVIRKQSMNMKEIIDSLLELSRINNKTFSKENINISSILREMAYERKLLLKDKNIRIIPEIEENIIINTNQTLFERLADNLISNAIKFTKDEIIIKLYRENNSIKFSVADNGIGIDRDNIEKIWQRFYQIDKSRNKAHNQGAGLGLSLVANIVKLNGWSINVESKINEGSIFTVTI